MIKHGMETRTITNTNPEIKTNDKTHRVSKEAIIKTPETRNTVKITPIQQDILPRNATSLKNATSVEKQDTPHTDVLKGGWSKALTERDVLC